MPPKKSRKSIAELNSYSFPSEEGSDEVPPRPGTPPAEQPPAPISPGGIVIDADDDEPEEDWDAVNRQFIAAKDEDETREAAGAAPAPPIGFADAYGEIRDKQSATWKKFLIDPETQEPIRRVAAHVETGGFWGCVWSCCHSDIVEDSPDYNERDLILCCARLPMDHSNEVHRRTLLTIHRKLTKPKRSEPDVRTTGDHWLVLGFQGNDPGTDLRAGGMFGLLQMLFLLDMAPCFAEHLFRASRNPLADFPLALVCLNFTGIALDVLKARNFHDMIAKKRKAKVAEKKNRRDADANGTGRTNTGFGAGDVAKLWEEIVVAEVMGEFYVGILYLFYKEWIEKPNRVITDFADIKAKLKKYGLANVGKVVAQYPAACDRKSFIKKVDPKKVVTDDVQLKFDDF